MSLPPELRVLCFQLSAIPVPELPRRLPTLLRYISQCQAPLSSPTSNANANLADASASSGLIHKLKTQLSALLNGRSPEGRFAAMVMIKGVVEVGEWEILRGSESWVRGLLSILVKPDPVVSKELCIMALTKIYCLTHQYPTLIREITTPMLPSFITSCLNLVSASPDGAPGLPCSLVEAVFQSFTTLLPRHTTLYRPFASRIRTVTRSYLAPTVSDGMFVPLSTRESARHLVVALHQTAPKNGGGEEWGKEIRNIVKDIHMTADNVFRAVIEDWESTAGYTTAPVDLNLDLCGGGNTPSDLPAWNGILAGVERLTGLIEFLTEYFRSETSPSVSIPLGAIVDMITRMLSISIPSSSSSSGQGSVRLHPGIDRDEKDALWCGMPQIYIAGLQLVDAIATRLDQGFVPLADGILCQLLWSFPSGRSNPEFRSVTYTVMASVLIHVGQSLNKSQTSKLAPIIRWCCKDLVPIDPNSTKLGVAESVEKTPNGHSITASQNSNALLHHKGISLAMGVENSSINAEAKLQVAAAKLLPLLLSTLPQQHLDMPLRSLVERTAILTHNKHAMLSSVLYPFLGKNGMAMASILPHLTRDFGSDDIVEIILRPRMPPLPTSNVQRPLDDTRHGDSEDESMDFIMKPEPAQEDHVRHDRPMDQQPGLGHPEDHPIPGSTSTQNTLCATSNVFVTKDSFCTESPFAGPSWKTTADTAHGGNNHETHSQTKMIDDVHMASEGESSDNESVHLTMQLDTDSDSDTD
ncbi:uncharacterized protein BP5553_09530 [Venustampulla echinocandica]|uniref:Pre-rRNA-processing protein RIX1 n=1 Tax=Venustampulla echinocandica TaxID=2656787 RepID=A0A370TCZ0_9HELO|nr:uncharacterized protein BP5553_09530 [Venustampulla echinocandica]RDL32128.1 hypothetical protein BP5553_09530 [Venustampulla echinocandica]